MVSVGRGGDDGFVGRKLAFDEIDEACDLFLVHDRLGKIDEFREPLDFTFHQLDKDFRG